MYTSLALRFSTIGILSLCFAAPAPATDQPAEVKELKFGNWTVESFSEHVSYSANGSEIHGNRFGFARIRGNCDQNLILMTKSSHNNDIKKFKDQTASFGFAFPDTREGGEMPVEFIAHHNFTSDLVVIIFSNTVVTGEFLQQIGVNSRVLIKLEQPKELATMMDREIEEFKLNGYQEASKLSLKMCRDMPAAPER